MGFFNFLKRVESLIAVDIGFSAVKLLELDDSQEKPRLLNLAMKELPADAFSGNMINKPDKIAEVIGDLLAANEIVNKRVATAVPSPNVFTKRVKMPAAGGTELRTTVQYEAANFIPHNIEAVKLDYHIVGEAQKNQLDVLVAAAKNEVVDSYLECIGMAGLEIAVVDVDYFALQNMFELCYPEFLEKTVALINIGARYSAINICRQGQALFTGDISLGGKALNDALMQGLGISFAESEKLKISLGRKTPAAENLSLDAACEILDKHVEYAASEFNRQLSFFWNACGAEGGIDQIMLCGGGSLLPELPAELSGKSGIECLVLDPLRGLDCRVGFDRLFLAEMAPFMGVAVGLALRHPGDKVMPEIE